MLMIANWNPSLQLLVTALVVAVSVSMTWFHLVCNKLTSLFLSKHMEMIRFKQCQNTNDCPANKLIFFFAVFNLAISCFTIIFGLWHKI